MLLLRNPTTPLLPLCLGSLVYGIMQFVGGYDRIRSFTMKHESLKSNFEGEGVEEAVPD